MRRRCALIGVVVVAAGACGTTIPIESSQTDDGGAAPQVDGSNATGGDGAPPVDVFDAGRPAEHGGNGNEDPCSESDPPGPADVFVTSNANDVRPCGSVAEPCTLDNALALKPSVIDIADGVYRGDFRVVSLNGLRVRGGWKIEGATWTRSCTEKMVTIRTDASPQGMLVDGSAVTFAYVDIASRPTAVQAGEGLYGLVVMNGSRVTLDHVNISSVDGLDGASGATGQTPLVPGCTTAGDGSFGGEGGAGAAGRIDFEAAGVRSTPAWDGASGAAGANGTAAELPPLIVTGYRCLTKTNECGQGQCSKVRDGASAGKNGCGGGGGSGGAAGGNGGTSIAVYVSGASSVNVVGGSMTSGRAGNGGAGGSGGAGAPGSPGQVGPDTEVPNCYTQPLSDKQCADTSIVSPPPTCMPDSPTNLGLTQLIVPGGLAGGGGGHGGAGGAGGSGAGGFSYAVWRDALSVVDFDGKTTFTHGAAGAAGAPDAPAGAAGDSNP